MKRPRKPTSWVDKSSWLADAYAIAAFAKNQRGWSLRDANLIVNMVQVFRADARKTRLYLETVTEESCRNCIKDPVVHKKPPLEKKARIL